MAVDDTGAHCFSPYIVKNRIISVIGMVNHLFICLILCFYMFVICLTHPYLKLLHAADIAMVLLVIQFRSWQRMIGGG